VRKTFECHRSSLACHTVNYDARVFMPRNELTPVIDFSRPCVQFRSKNNPPMTAPFVPPPHLEKRIPSPDLPLSPLLKPASEQLMTPMVHMFANASVPRRPIRTNYLKRLRIALIAILLSLATLLIVRFDISLVKNYVFEAIQDATPPLDMSVMVPTLVHNMEDAVNWSASQTVNACVYTGDHFAQCTAMIRAAHEHMKVNWFALVPKTDELRRVGHNLHMAVTNITMRLISTVPDIKADELLLRYVLAPVLTTILRFTAWGKSTPNRDEDDPNWSHADDHADDQDHVNLLVNEVMSHISNRVS